MAEKRKMAFFEKYLTLWVALCIAGGILLGQLAGDTIELLSSWEIANVNIPVAILIWLMIYPMMLQIDFSSVRKVGQKPKGIILTVIVNWLIKPFTMLFSPGFSFLKSMGPLLSLNWLVSTLPAPLFWGRLLARPWCLSGVTSPMGIPTIPWCRFR